MNDQNRWLEMIESNAGHSDWYVERFRKMEADGNDLAGEARMIDAMADRGSHILDAGCGPGRTGGWLHGAGHRVVGVDLDPVLIDAAEQDHPGPDWLVGDLSELDLPGRGIDEPFALIVGAGNVMAFLAPSTRVEVLRRLGLHLAPEGRIVIGFGAGRDYDFAEFEADVAAAGLGFDQRFSTWDLRPLTPDSDFLVAVLVRT